MNVQLDERTTLKLPPGTLEKVRKLAVRRVTSSANVMRQAVLKELAAEDRRIERQKERERIRASSANDAVAE